MMRTFRISAMAIATFLFVVAGSVQTPAQDVSDAQGGTDLTPLEVAKVYGIDNWEAVEELQYTFNVKLGQRETSRKWTWRPQIDEISYEGQTPEGEAITRTYSRADLPENPEGLEKQIDHWFINDSYWLLFPFHLVWDDNVTITNEGSFAAPISGEESSKMTVQYGEEGGYTPGDKYVLFVGEDGIIREWSYTPAGMEQPRLIATWEEHQDLGPLKISMLHRDEAGFFKLWFSDVKVTTTGGITAEGGWTPQTDEAGSAGQ